MTTNILESGQIIRFSDCDPFRHLNNSKYVDYFLNAREDHLKSAYDIDMATLASAGQAWVVRKHTISYLRPAFYNEYVIIQSLLLDVTSETLLLEMLMLDKLKRQLKAVMHTEFVSVDPATGKKRQHESSFMDFLNDKKVSFQSPFSHDVRINYWLQHLKTNVDEDAN